MLKRIMAALLCSLIGGSLLISCGSDAGASAGADTTAGGENGETTAAETTTAETLPSAYDYLPEKDYGGTSFVVTTPDTGTRYLPGQIITEEESGDIIMDAAYTRNRNVEEKFNIVLEHIPTALNSFYSGLRSTVMSGDDSFDLAAGFLRNMSGLAVEPIFLDISELPYTDLSNPWYSGANEALNFKGKQSLMFSDYTCITLSCTYGLFFNKDMGAKYGVPDLTETVLDGTWTIDKLLDYSKGITTDLDGNGELNELDQYGHNSYVSHLQANGDTSFVYQYGMGNFTTTMNDEGLPELTLYNEKQVSIVEKLYALYYEDERASQVNDGKISGTMFANGQSLFFNAIIMHAANYMRDMNDDFMVMPLPKYDEAQAQYYTTISQSSSFLYCVPLTVSDPEMSSIVFDALSYEGSQSVIPAFFETSMKIKYARDDVSSQVFDLLRDSTYVDFGLVYDGGVGMSTLISKVLSTKSKDFASAYTAIEAQAISQYETVIENLSK